MTRIEPLACPCQAIPISVVRGICLSGALLVSLCERRGVTPPIILTTGGLTPCRSSGDSSMLLESSVRASFSDGNETTSGQKPA
jgi:hypothetical protein